MHACTLSQCRNSIFLVEFSGNVGRNIFMMSIARPECYFSASFTFWVPILDIWGSIFWFSYSFWQLGVGGREKRTRNVQKKAGQEKQNRHEKWKMKNDLLHAILSLCWCNFFQFWRKIWKIRFFNIILKIVLANYQAKSSIISCFDISFL